MGKAGRGLTDDDHQCGNPRGRGGYVAVANMGAHWRQRKEREREARAGRARTLLLGSALLTRRAVCVGISLESCPCQGTRLYSVKIPDDIAVAG